MSMSNEQTKRGSWEHFLLRAAKEISLSGSAVREDQRPILPSLRIPQRFRQSTTGGGAHFCPRLHAPEDNDQARFWRQEDLDTIDADAIICSLMPRMLELERFWMPLRNASRLAAVSRRKSSNYAGAWIVYVDETRYHIDVTPARAINGNSQGNGEGKLEVPDRETGVEGEQPDPVLKMVAGRVNANHLLWRNIWLSRKATALLMPPLRIPAPESGLSRSKPTSATIKLLK
ncbi:hypothetical protein ACG3RN_21950, partial [Pseudomonas aeruginosa]